MSLSEEQAEAVLPVAHVAAQATYRRVSDGLGYADLKAEALLWASSHPRKVSEYLAVEEEGSAERLLSRAMQNACMAATQKELARRHPEMRTAQLHYTLAQIREELLPCLWDRDAWSSRPTKDRNEVRGSAPANERGTWMAMLADVGDAYRKLPKDMQRLLLQHYGLQWTTAEIARESDQTEDGVQKALQRATKAIHHHLGGDKPQVCERDCECHVGPLVTPRHSTNGARLAAMEKEYEG